MLSPQSGGGGPRRVGERRRSMFDDLVQQCGYCWELGHRAERCLNRPPDQLEGAAEVEHRSGNGPYTGPVKVRVIPRGVGGAELAGESPMTAAQLSPLRGREKQERQARARRIGAARQRKVGRDQSGGNVARRPSASI